ncbi:type II toxin-antitoxin system antitoxin, RelB/DinJ family [Bartonella taylorii]|uniref:type II toxin-antitoxin system antitoxin, RelB/DinJ family n=1 Tax=Bartonella taylorii TaxID=33046 RepID=UPI001FF07AA0|nr:type II toxin-antitoxin system antitoxin, RelB/DinJ family [Bartonella taylorii]
MAVSCRVGARIPEEYKKCYKSGCKSLWLISKGCCERVDDMRIVQDEAIPSVLFQPNAKTIAVFAQPDEGNLKKLNFINRLFDDLYVDD